MKSNLNGQWLWGSAPMEDSQKCHQIKSSSKAKQMKQYSFLFINVLLGVPLQSLLLSLYRDVFIM